MGIEKREKEERRDKRRGGTRGEGGQEESRDKRRRGERGEKRCGGGGNELMFTNEIF